MGDPVVHAAVMLQHLGTISIILNAISIIMGIGLFVGGLFKLKRYGEMRTFMSHQMTIWAPTTMVIAGVLLLMLPITIKTSLLAFWGAGNTSPLAYTSSGLHNIDAYIPVINAFVRLIGVGAIIRACTMFSRSGEIGGQPGQSAKAMLYLFGGILCVHIMGTVDLIKYLFDINQV
ncbi:MAG: type IV secretion protein IcmC [Coxiella sp. (in: Bacteria)]|nr:MAG: type IV secretion protein IcmC [Coxiella sp. (in: g-proteobacteria)]